MDASYRRSGAGGGGGSAPRTVEDIFKDYRARRNAIHRALTHGTRPPLPPRLLNPKPSPNPSPFLRRRRGVLRAVRSR